MGAPPVTPPTGLMNSRLDGAWSAIQTGGSSSLIPDPFVVAINGRPYLHDLEFKPWKRQAMRATTTTITRTQADTSNEPGEQSLSTESLWRRTQDSWHLGAAQVYLDRSKSQEFSFRQSKGVNPWTQWELTLLNDTTKSLASTNNNLDLVTCGSHVYVIDGASVKYTNDLVTWHTVTGTPVGVIASSICTDGFNVWMAYGADGVYTTTEGSATASQYVTSAISGTAIIRFTLGRLMLGTGNTLYNIIASGVLPSALMVSDYSNLQWVDVTTGNGCIFAAGNSGNVGVIYSIQTETDGTALSAPILCGQLPNGENVNCIYGYAGSGVAIGTSLGWRFAEQALANSVSLTVALNIGPLNILGGGLIGVPVTAFSAYNRFIWGTYQNFDGVSTGLFRMDPSQFVSDLAPAFASDVMATTQGQVNSICHFNGQPVFSVTGVGVYATTSTYVASGYVDSGFITYGIADDKMPVFVDVAMLPMTQGQSIQTLFSIDSGSFTNLGTYSQAHPYVEWATPQYLCQTMEIREVLISDTATHTNTPTLTRHTMRGIPAPPAPTDWSVVIQLREVVRIKDNEYPMVPSQEYTYLDELRISKQIVSLQIGNIGPFDVTIEGIDWIPEQWASLSGELNGVAVVTCRTVV